MLITVAGDEGKDVTVEMSIEQDGAETDLRITGKLMHGVMPGDDVGLLRVTLNDCISCDEECATLEECIGEFPQAEQLVATMRPLFIDDDMSIFREITKPKDREKLCVVLSRLPPEDGDDLKAGMELDDDYGA